MITDDANMQAALSRVAGAGCRVLTNCTSASVTIIERGRPITVGSTDDTAQALDDAQYTAPEGPCLTAAHERRVVRIDDTGNDERWPRFAASARSQWRAQFAVGPAGPVGPTTRSPGSTSTATWSPGSVTTTNSWRRRSPPRRRSSCPTPRPTGRVRFVTNLTTAMETRAVIEQAKGVLMSTHRIDADAAFEVLREISQTSNRKLHDVAADVVDESRRGDDDAQRFA